MTTEWLNCSVTEGMFSDEKIIELADLNDTCFVVPASEVDQSNSKVRVVVVDYDGQRMAILPTNQRHVVRWQGNNRIPA